MGVDLRFYASTWWGLKFLNGEGKNSPFGYFGSYFKTRIMTHLEQQPDFSDRLAEIQTKASWI